VLILEGAGFTETLTTAGVTPLAGLMEIPGADAVSVKSVAAPLGSVTANCCTATPAEQVLAWKSRSSR